MRRVTVFTHTHTHDQGSPPSTMARIEQSRVEFVPWNLFSRHICRRLKGNLGGVSRQETFILCGVRIAADMMFVQVLCAWGGGAKSSFC